jgi:putative DNA primase/helicase
MSIVEVAREFRSAVAAAGMVPPAEVVADGRIHRFSPSGRRTDSAGWYVIHPDGLPAGAFGDWRTGVSQRWRAASSRSMTDVERADRRERIERDRRQREAEQARRHAEARARAARLWRDASPAVASHPYLLRKGVKQHGLRQRGNALLVPMRAGGVLHSLQFINAEGGKRFLAGGRVGGCCFGIGRPAGSIIVCEGYATGASLFEATGIATAAAFSACNLRSVAHALRARFPSAKLIVAADHDARTPGNPGLSSARAAALEVGGLLATPCDPHCDESQDFNDLAQRKGAAAVRERIAQAAPVRYEFGATQ